MKRLDAEILGNLLLRINRRVSLVLFVLFLSIISLCILVANPVISVSIGSVLLFVSFLIIRLLIKPLYEILDIYKEKEDFVRKFEEFADRVGGIASGGFREAISVEENGAIGKLSHAFNSLLESTNNFIKELDSLSERTLSSSRQLNDTIRQTSNAMEEVNIALQNLTEETGNLNANIEEIAEGARKVDNLVQDGISQINDMERQMKQIMQAAEETAVMINELNKISGEIEKIVGVISNIAEQTNLLALNAAIEAAHAGEQGRGFAVVANEVRQLSYQTQDLLKEIRNMIGNLSDQMSNAVTVIKSGNQQVAEGERFLSEVTNTFKIIAERVQDIADRIEMTAKSSREITIGSREISSASEQQMIVNARLTDMASNLADIATKLKDRLAETQVGAYNLEINLDEFDRELGSINEIKRRALKNELKINNEFIIGVIARLEPVKGHKFLIEGLKPLFSKYKDLLCLIVGDGSLENELKQIVAREGLVDKIRFLGYRGDIPQLLSIIDLIVLTSEKEGVPPKIICEALAARKPVVATNTVGSRYLVRDRENGILVNYGDTKALMDAVDFFIKNPEKCREYGQVGRRLIEELVKEK
jgi:methyl-accepting chemotaxis protein